MTLKYFCSCGLSATLQRAASITGFPSREKTAEWMGCVCGLPCKVYRAFCQQGAGQPTAHKCSQQTRNDKIQVSWITWSWKEQVLTKSDIVTCPSLISCRYVCNTVVIRRCTILSLQQTHACLERTGSAEILPDQVLKHLVTFLSQQKALLDVKTFSLNSVPKQKLSYSTSKSRSIDFFIIVPNMFF